MRVISFNCKGLKPRNYDYVKYLFDQCEVLLIQETWLYQFEAKYISSLLPDSMIHLVSSMDEADVGRLGRTYGGTAIIWNKSIPYNITPIQTQSSRISVLSLTDSSRKVIIFNVYMPNDLGTMASLIEFGDVLNEISAIMEVHIGYTCVIGGDFNVNFKNENSLNVGALRRFLDIESFCCSGLDLIQDSSFTFESVNGGRSVIDHFLFYENLRVKKFDILVDGINLSGPTPIRIEFKSNKNVNKSCKIDFIEKQMR